MATFLLISMLWAWGVYKDPSNIMSDIESDLSSL
uniref:ATP synthase subunit 8 n=1 Tax=Ostrea lurida TaxID=627230 RepID=U3LW80_9BIVA|nr:ATP synthase F0 subunit 8 [Ostrea lurida]AGM48341.1 ATP synthase subunit 8 [Ostrea lurida]